MPDLMRGGTLLGILLQATIYDSLQGRRDDRPGLRNRRCRERLLSVLRDDAKSSVTPPQAANNGMDLSTCWRTRNRMRSASNDRARLGANAEDSECHREGRKAEESCDGDGARGG